LLNYTNPDRINHSSEELDKGTYCQYLYYSLEELLSFVGNHFSEYFDQDMWIPENYRLIVVHQVKANIKTLETEFLKLGIDQELRAHALGPLNEFLDNTSSNEITYRKVIYLKQLQKSMLELIHSENDDPKVSLQWILFQLNFNPIKYFQYCTEQINKHVNETEDISERLDRLALIQKLINQYPVKSGYCYDANHQSLKHQLTDWIAQEMEYLESRIQRMTDLTDKGESISERFNLFKIKLDLSVAQLAYLIRVFVEVKIIQSPNVALLLRYLSKIVQTKRTESIALPSVQGKYYKTESSTKKAIRNLLLQMIKHIESDGDVV
jgi:hypothetical protein